ncbi:MAG: right-handed parallel beta-helix repeat-containing protein [Clostridia bacterium]|nr:right-handed parallel beta-helix repeat-containing protein [Clostridia bacterium]
MLKKFCAAMLGTVMVSGVASSFSAQKLSLNASADESLFSAVNSLPIYVLNETFDFEDADIGKEIAGWNSWVESKGTSGALDSEFTLGKENDGNKVAVLERTAASTDASMNYQVKKSVNIGYGTERIGIGFRIKSMDEDNGKFQLIIETDNGYMVIHIDLSQSCIITPQITTPFISLRGNDSYEAAPLDEWYSVELIIDTNIKQIDFYTCGVYRGSSDIANLDADYGGDVSNGKVRKVSIGTSRTEGVKSGGDSAMMYVDDITVKTDATPKAKITQTEISDGNLSSITVKKNTDAGETGKLIAAAYEYKEGGATLKETRIIDVVSGKNVLTDTLTIPENGEIQIFAFDMKALTPMAAVVSEAQTPTYYVSPDGDDTNNGTRMRPWKTLHKAVKEAQAGDTIILADGKYYENYIASFKSSGSKDAPIIVKAENKGKAEIIYPSYTSGKTKLTIPDGSNYVMVEGISFSQEKPATDENATNDVYLWCEGDYCNIKNNSFSGALEEGIKLNRSTGTVISDNYIEDMVHEGIDVFNSDSVKVHDNEIHNVSRIGILAKGNTRNSQVYNNYVHNSTAEMSNCAYCIGGISNKTSPFDTKSGTGYECYSTDFYNNIALAHGSGKIDAAFKWYGTIDCRMYNNVAIGATTGIYFASYTAHWDWNPKNVNPVVKNNIIYNCGTAVLENTDSVQIGNKNSADFSYNLFYNCGSTPIYAGNVRISDPKFVSLTDDLHLQSDSPAIGRGSELQSTIPKYVLNEENNTITKSSGETINIEFFDKDGKKRTLPYDMGVYESN